MEHHTKTAPGQETYLASPYDSLHHVATELLTSFTAMRPISEKVGTGSGLHGSTTYFTN